MLKSNLYTFSTKMWIYPGEKGNWHFASLPKEDAAEIKKKFGIKTRGWGSMRVKVTIGNTNWHTSIFPDKNRGTYILPIKASVRKKEDLDTSQKPSITIEFI